MVRRKVTALFGMLALVLSAAACGSSSSSSGVSPSAYVKTVCEAIGPFEKDVQAREKTIANLGQGTSITQGKAALVAFLNAVVADTDTAINKIKNAGNPNVNNGKAIQTGIVGAFTGVRTALASAAKDAAALPTNSAQAFQTAAVSLGSKVQSSIGNIGQGLNGLKNAQLEAAAKKEPACTSIATG